ncbi:MAG: RAMP superfamily CRISPR-associated protein [Rhodoferax sp.]|nr:RAMP superfamily CRISPR-associated protein [Rhodoferax sp.]
MKPFLHTSRLALTPLSPIHIGCGEDFEPTNYVIVDGILYNFDPSRAGLNNAQRSQLVAAANNTNLLDIQCFFHNNAHIFKNQSRVQIEVSQGVTEKYENSLRRPAQRYAFRKNIINQFIIQRTAYTGRQDLPYIPGSSFKGMLRTAIVDKLNGGHPIQQNELRGCNNIPDSAAVEKRLLKGDFQNSPLRLLKVADLMPLSEPVRRIVFAVNRKKKFVLNNDGDIRPNCIEVLLHGQYRAFGSEAVITSLDCHNDPKTTPSLDLQPQTWHDIAKQANDYHKTQLEGEIQTLDGLGLLNPTWKRDIERLMCEIKQELQNGRVMLVRLGRYGGATSKTLSGNGVAKIKINQGPGQPPTIESNTKTVWLEAEHDTEQKHLLPLGWAVVEIDPEGDCKPLREWCERQPKVRPDMQKIRAGIVVEQAAAERQKIEDQARAAARKAVEQAEREAAELRAQALAAMTPQGQQIETLRQRCEELATRIRVNNYRKESPAPGQAGIYQKATDLVKLALENDDWSAAERSALADMLEQWLPQVISPWGKEQHKKIKLSTLRGIA